MRPLCAAGDHKVVGFRAAYIDAVSAKVAIDEKRFREVRRGNQYARPEALRTFLQAHRGPREARPV
jgi:hypothetical protein